MIPLPRASVLAGVMIVGIAAGVIGAVAVAVEVTTAVRPDIAIALVIGVPTVIGLLTILLSGSRWVTGLGASLLAVGPGWFATLATIQVVSGG